MRKKESFMHLFITIVLILLALAGFAYGVIAWRAHSGTFFFLIWEVFGLGCLALAILHHLGVLGRLPLALRVTGIAIIGVGLIVLGILLALITHEFHAEGESDLDYIIVLGAQMRQSGPSIILKERLDTAATYLQENPDTRCIVSGGQGYNEPCSEAQGMYEYLVSCGIDGDRILLEDQSTNTLENIRFSKSILDADCNGEYKNVGILTNNFHVYRATHIARKQGLHDVCGIAAPSHPLYLPNNTLRECIGVLKDTLVGNM
jgi:uncharacterized SAM-binding protein YcdF (DUF218 family)